MPFATCWGILSDLLDSSKERKYKVSVRQNWNIKLWFPWEDLKRHILLVQIRGHLRKVAYMLTPLDRP
jgi:hypothetical protein